MKRTKQILAIISLIFIAVGIIGFVISAFTTTVDTKAVFFGFFGGIIILPLFAWIVLFCVGRLTNKHTMAEFFPEDDQDQ